MLLPPRAQATVLLTVPFPGDGGTAPPLTPTEWGRFAAWLHARSLLPESLLSTPLAEILRELHDKTIQSERVEALLARGAALGLLMDKWSRAGIWVITRADTDYPTRLKKRLGAVSPAILFGCGNRRLLSGGGLAVVGSRNAGTEDLAYSRRLGELAAGNGQSVVSGAARGVDEAAILGALENEGTAVGVLASDLLSNSTAARYRRYITGNNLTFISATNPEARFTVGNAMGRNKYIYCLADAAVVVHSGPKGGTWSGAKENLKHNWVPLWIREIDDEKGGNVQLLHDPNTRPLPGDQKQLSFDILFPLAPSRPATEDGQDAPPSADDAPPVEPPAPTTAQPPVLEMTLYELFLHRVQALCQDEPCPPAALQHALGLQKTQLDIWLKQAVAEKHLIRLAKPVRYHSPRQSSLFVG